MTGFIPVPPDPWVPTATDSETKLFPAATMDALDEHNDGRYATTEQGEKADSAYQLPEDGVPATDLEESVRTSLTKADEAVPNTEAGRAALAASPELGAAIAGLSEWDFVVQQSPMGTSYVAVGRDEAFANADLAAAINAALASVDQRAASVLIGLRGTHECGETILVGNSTLIAGPSGRMATQISGDGITNETGPERVYAPQLVLDFSANDIDAIANDTPGASYRPHQWTVRDIGIKGGEYRTSLKRAGIKARYNTGGPNGGRCGLVTLERVYVEGFYYGVDLTDAGASFSADGGIDTAHVIDCHVHRCVIGYRGGFSDSRFLYCDAWQLLAPLEGSEVPAAFIINGRQDVIAFCEVEPSLLAADGIRIVDSGTGSFVDPIANTRGAIVTGNQFCGPRMANGIIVESGTIHRIEGNIIPEHQVAVSGKSIWLKSGVTETTVTGNTISPDVTDDSGSSSNAVYGNHVIGGVARDVALVRETDAAVLLADGLETVSRLDAVHSNIATGSGTLRLVYRTARRSEPVSAVRLFSGATAAGATPTLVRVGIYEVDGDGDLTLVGSTANDTTLLASSNTGYTKSLAAPLDLIAGVTYAIGVLIVTSATAPTLCGLLSPLAIGETGKPPRLNGAVFGLSDLPSSIVAGSIADNQHLAYIALA